MQCYTLFLTGVYDMKITLSQRLFCDSVLLCWQISNGSIDTFALTRNLDHINEMHNTIQRCPTIYYELYSIGAGENMKTSTCTLCSGTKISAFFHLVPL